MSVELIPRVYVEDVTRRIHAARQRALEQNDPLPLQGGDAAYWQAVFETNAAEVMREIPSVTLPAGYVVRYCFFGLRERDLLVRPFVARASTELDSVRRLMDWHAAPDNRSARAANAPSQDVELLYRHFSFPQTAMGFFDYWLLMQELWASQRWAHSRILATPEEFSLATANPGWQVLAPVKTYEPAVVCHDEGARLAVLVESPLERFAIALESIEVRLDQSVVYGEPVIVASGPKGYFV